MENIEEEVKVAVLLELNKLVTLKDEQHYALRRILNTIVERANLKFDTLSLKSCAFRD